MENSELKTIIHIPSDGEQCGLPDIQLAVNLSEFSSHPKTKQKKTPF